MAWASAHPERVGRLVLANTTARFTEAVGRARRAVVESYSEEPWHEDARAALEAHPSGDYADDAELAGLLERELPFYFPRWGADEQAVGDLMKAGGLNSDALRHFNGRIAPGMDLRPGLARVKAPVLVITGEIEPFFDRSTAEDIAAALPDATVVVVPDAGHFIFGESETRQAWAEAILDFLDAAE
jgi:pimeloyl-ACP methyl ester carboxylesterase